MKDIIQSLVRHVEEVAGIELKLKPAPNSLEKLPGYFGSLYEAWDGDLFDRQYLFLVSKGKDRSTPAEIAGHYRVAMRELGKPVAFVLVGLESFARQRLVKYRVPFVVPRSQIYLPHFLIDLREGTAIQGLQCPVQMEHLSGAAQSLLLFYLQKPRAPELCSLREWADLLGYSSMTVTRIANELGEAKLCGIKQSGRSILLDFDHDGRTLWEKALPFLRTPVRGRSYVRSAGKEKLPWLQAGIPALSRHTILADDGNAVVAVSISEYKRALADERIKKVPYPDEGAVTVERWRYRPEILADGPTVDPLSLYLSLREDQDERVQAALKELLKGVQW